MPTGYFLDRVALLLIICLFPTASALLLYHNMTSLSLGISRIVAYWIISSLFLWETWRWINSEWSFFTGKDFRRRVLATFALPGAILVSAAVIPFMLEGFDVPKGVIIALGVALGITAGAIGFIATLQNRNAQCNNDDLGQAIGIKNGCLKVFGAFAVFLSGIAAIEKVRGFYAETVANWHLIAATCVLIAALALIFLLYPFLLVQSMKTTIAARKAQPPPKTQ